MKKKIIILCLLLALIIIGVVFFNKEKSNLKIYQGNDITLSIKKGTLTNASATVIITDKSNNNHIYGWYFILEKKKDKAWFKMPANETWHTLEGYIVNEKNQIELKQDWKEIYGELKKENIAYSNKLVVLMNTYMLNLK